MLPVSGFISPDTIYAICTSQMSGFVSADIFCAIWGFLVSGFISPDIKPDTRKRLGATRLQPRILRLRAMRSAQDDGIELCSPRRYPFSPVYSV